MAIVRDSQDKGTLVSMEFAYKKQTEELQVRTRAQIATLEQKHNELIK